MWELIQVKMGFKLSFQLSPVIREKEGDGEGFLKSDLSWVGSSDIDLGNIALKNQICEGFDNEKQPIFRFYSAFEYKLFGYFHFQIKGKKDVNLLGCSDSWPEIHSPPISLNMEKIILSL